MLWLLLQIVVDQGGLSPGGLNFDAKVRRESTDLEDMFIAHIGESATTIKMMIIMIMALPTPRRPGLLLARVWPSTRFHNRPPRPPAFAPLQAPWTRSPAACAPSRS